MRQVVPLALALALGFGLGLIYTRAAQVPEVVARPELPEVDEDGDPERPEEPRRRRKKTAEYRLDNTPADPPPATVARIAPTPLDAPAPAVTPVDAPASPPHVVVVLGCTVRKDQLSPWGGDPAVTPYLQHLADVGVVFDDTIAAAPWTRAASTAILTGRHAVSIGMVEPGAGRNDRRLPEAITTLAEEMHDRGYYTIGATANPNLLRYFGFAQGFDDYQHDIEASWSEKIEGEDILTAVLTGLDRNRASGDTRPVYVQVMLLDAHAPRTALAEEYARFAVEGEPERLAQYRAHLFAFDQSVQRLRHELERRGLTEDNTVTVVIADHGEGLNFPKHHGFAHGQYLTPSTVHVPWLMQGPGVARGQRVLGVTSQVDLLPTLLGTIGRPLAADAPTDGMDLSEVVRGRGHLSPRTRAFSDTWFGESSRAALFTPGVQCQQDFGSTARQLEKGKFTPGCYDRHADPLYLTPIEDELLMPELVAWRAARTAELEAAASEQAEIDDEVNEQLQMLGYKE